MQQWVAWLTNEGRRYHPVVRAAIAHHGFVAVHPFEDGNGRTGRLLTSLEACVALPEGSQQPLSTHT